jgi:hypothetical protein
MSLQKTKSNTLESIAAERHHNSTGNRPGVIAHLEHHIEVLHIFFSFWAAGLCGRGKKSKVEYTYGWYSVSGGKIWYAKGNKNVNEALGCKQKYTYTWLSNY